jgi:hypothetical protein
LRRRFSITHEILAHARLPDVDAERQSAHTGDSQTHRSRSGVCSCGRFFADR